jgi:periplasmic divalent cation tolerance protein
MTNVLVVVVTCPTKALARRIAHALVKQRLAACVNIVSGPVQSVYRWEGKTEQAREVLLIIKTVRSQWKALLNHIQRLHSYQVPEILAVPVSDGLPAYLRWVRESCRS